MHHHKNQLQNNLLQALLYQLNDEELEYYKSSKKYDYYIEKPYKQMYFYDNKVKFKEYGYSARGEAKNGSSIHFCLALCGYSKERIIETIENHIIQDNLEE